MAIEAAEGEAAAETTGATGEAPVAAEGASDTTAAGKTADPAPSPVPETTQTATAEPVDDIYARAATAEKAVVDQFAVLTAIQADFKRESDNLRTVLSDLSVIEAEAAASGISVADLHAAIKE